MKSGNHRVSPNLKDQSWKSTGFFTWGLWHRICSHGPWPCGRNVPPHPLWSPRHPHGRRAYVSTRLKTTILVGRNHPCLALIPLLQLQAQHLEKASKVFFSKVWNSNAWTLDGKNIKSSRGKEQDKDEKLQTFPNQLGLQLGYKSTSLCWCPDPSRFRKTLKIATVVREWFQFARLLVNVKSRNWC